MVVKVVKVFPMRAHEYTDRQGQRQVFKSKALLLHDGGGSFYAEAIQENAGSIEALDLQAGDVVCVFMTCSAREFTDKEGNIRYSNEFTIRNIMRL